MQIQIKYTCDAKSNELNETIKYIFNEMLPKLMHDICKTSQSAIFAHEMMEHILRLHCNNHDNTDSQQKTMDTMLSNGNYNYNKLILKYFEMYKMYDDMLISPIYNIYNILNSFFHMQIVYDHTNTQVLTHFFCFVCLCLCLPVSISLFACVCMCMCVFVCVCVCVRLFAYFVCFLQFCFYRVIFVSLFAHTQTHTRTHSHSHIYNNVACVVLSTYHTLKHYALKRKKAKKKIENTI